MEVRGETVGTLVISEYGGKYGGKRGDCGHISDVSMEVRGETVGTLVISDLFPSLPLIISNNIVM